MTIASQQNHTTPIPIVLAPPPTSQCHIRVTTITSPLRIANSSPTPESNDDTFHDLSDSGDFICPSNPTHDNYDINDLLTPMNDNHNTTLPPPLQPKPNSISYITSHPPSSCQHDISTFATQNTHGLRPLPRDSEGKLITSKPYDYTRYEHLITMMKTKNLDVYFIQETWLEDDVFDETINGYHVFRHNGSKGNHNFRGVAIILSPRYYDGWKAAGAKPPLTTDATSEFAGRFISINITLKSFDRLKKQV